MPGKEYVVKTPDGMARYRLFGTGVQLYRVFVIGTQTQVQGKEADILFDSFKRKVPGDTKVAKPGDDPKPDAPVKFTKPAKAAAATSYLKIVSSPGDYIGQGKTYDYKGDQLTLKTTARGVNVRGLLWRSHPEAMNFGEGKNLSFSRVVNDAGGQVLLDQRVRRGGSARESPKSLA